MFSNILPTRGKLASAAQQEVDTIKPKVLVGVPGFAGVTPEAQENFFHLAYRLGRDCPEFDVALRIVIKREQFRARNNLVDLAIANGCDYLLMLDDDMIVPPDLFQRLLAHDKDVVGALYYQRGGAFHPVIMKSFSKKDGLMGVQFINHFDPMLRKPGLYKLDGGVIGGGCMLFKVDVFRKIQQPYFWIDGIVGTDVHICDKLNKAGVDLWVDTSLELGHIGSPTTYTSRNIPRYSKHLGEVNEALWNDLKERYLMNDIQIEQEMVGAAANRGRREKWDQAERETWDQIYDYYKIPGKWQVFNLAFYNCTQFDEAREWAINEFPKALEKQKTIADVGCGLGYVSVPLAQAGFNVTAIDLAGTTTLEFCRWRRDKLNLDNMKIVEQTGPVPEDLPEPVDTILCISAFDHMYDGAGFLDWVGRNLKMGGYFYCDSWRGVNKEEEPQHINAMDGHTFMKRIKKMGLVQTPENEILFKREK